MKIFKILLSTFLVVSLCILPCEAKTPWSSKPTLGSQINWSHPLSRGLVGCWLMNEGGGNKSKDIAKTNNITWSGTYTNISSLVGNAITVDGTSGVGSHKNPLYNTSLTWAGWVYVNTASNSKQIYDSSSGGTNGGYSFSIGAGGNFQFTKNAINDYDAGLAVPRTQWIFLIVTYSNPDGAYHFYYVKYGTPSLVKDTHGNTASTSWVAGSGTGLFGESRFGGFSPIWFGNNFQWNRVLSPSEIQQLYQEPYCFIKPQTDWDMIKQAVSNFFSGQAFIID